MLTGKKYYEEVNGLHHVICILDPFCVRYMVLENGKKKVRQEFSNRKENLCFKNALKSLNK